jgi:hypothetical protein
MAPLVAGCLTSSTPFELTEEAVLFPATCKEALPLAEKVARGWRENAFLTGMGGGFTVTDAEGRARNHTFIFHARDGFTTRELKVHLFSGLPWKGERTVDPPVILIDGFEEVLDSREAVAFAINEAEDWNEQNPGQIIRIPEFFAPRISTKPVYPEFDAANQILPEEAAWRVDFLVEGPIEDSTSPVWWSTVRFYLDPVTGQRLGDPEIPVPGPVLYPFP